jgi:PhnB protein
MSEALRAAPDGRPTVSPYLIVDDAARLIRFVEAAFGGALLEKAEDDQGGVIHAEVQVGDSVIMLGSANAEWPALSAMIHLYLPDVDGVFQRALEAGATAIREPGDMPYGDRTGGVRGPCGNQWWIATHLGGAREG